MILNLYKPKGITSFGVVAQIKKQLNLKKVGHAGTLDPLAEGVLVVLTGDDTKMQDRIMHQGKQYEAQIAFGISSESLDLEFTPKYLSHIDLITIKSELPKILPEFIGELEQKIPAYSAKKVNGQPLYKLARNPNKPESTTDYFKKIIIEKIDVLNYEEHAIETDLGSRILPVVTLRVDCSQGTYIRTLATDLGNKLGTDGVLIKLIRTKVGNYLVSDSKKLEEVK